MAFVTGASRLGTDLPLRTPCSANPSMLSFKTMACLAFCAIPSVAIRAARDFSISHEEDIETRLPTCFHAFFVLSD